MRLLLRYTCTWSLLTGMAVLLGMVLGQQATAADFLRPLDLRRVQVGGEIGRRIDITVHNNLLKLNAERDFIAPFRNKSGHRDDFFGLGMLIDAAVRFAAYTQNDEVLALKKHLVEEAIRSQESDGYIGTMKAPDRMWTLWDLHEMAYLILGLTDDYCFFGEKASLDAARKTADYIIERWATMPDDWTRQTHINVHESGCGLERAVLTLFRATKDRRYLDFCVRQQALARMEFGHRHWPPRITRRPCLRLPRPMPGAVGTVPDQSGSTAVAAGQAGGLLSHRRGRHDHHRRRRYL